MLKERWSTLHSRLRFVLKIKKKSVVNWKKRKHYNTFKILRCERIFDTEILVQANHTPYQISLTSAKLTALYTSIV